MLASNLLNINIHGVIYMKQDKECSHSHVVTGRIYEILNKVDIVLVHPFKSLLCSIS